MPLATPQGSKEYNTGRKFALFVVLFEKYGAVLSGVPRNTFCVYPFRLTLLAAVVFYGQGERE